MSCNLVNIHTLLEHRDSLAKYLPLGIAWTAKNLTDKVMYQLLLGLSGAYKRVEAVQDEIGCEHDINQTVQFLDLWESALGIPDECFDTSGSIEQRRANILIKLGARSIVTEADFIKLAQILGFAVVIIRSGIETAVFPFTFPIIFWASKKSARFTMVVELEKSKQPNIFPFTFPITFGGDTTNILECFFNKLKPANTTVIFRYIL